ncbi:MAG: TonB family protein, partial [Rhodospirillales bacterium]
RPQPAMPNPTTEPIMPRSPPPPANPNAVPTWQGLTMARLQAAKNYPSEARLNRHQGVAYLRIALNRNGDVTSAQIDRSSGFPALDAEALALAQRVTPLPPPPPELLGETIVLVIPVRFSLR